jgi:hypothetical protein
VKLFKREKKAPISMTSYHPVFTSAPASKMVAQVQENS